MEKLNEIIQRIQSTFQAVIDGVMSLAFQPVYFLLAIVESIINIWTAHNNEELNIVQDETQQQVAQYPSPNEGRYAEECDYPVAHKIGYKVNTKEQEELDKIKTELKLNGE